VAGHFPEGYREPKRGGEVFERVRIGVLSQLLLVLLALWAAQAAARPGSGPRETVDQTFTSTRPSSPTGFSFSATYHAAGDKQAAPPALRRMLVYPPRGLRYDTSVPARCTAGDAVLQAMGPAACPANSLLGRGTAEGIFFVPFAHDFVFDHYKHPTYVLNNKNEQIVLIQSEGYTVVRGRIRRDGSMDWVLPTCFPKPPGADCGDEYIIQLKTISRLAPYTRKSGGRLRSYGTTPPRCPARGYWQTTVRYWWADGSVDSVATRQPCTSRERAG
jgi:hypothetical protein